MAKHIGLPFLYAVSVTVIVLVLGANLGASRWMGAHPFWHIQVVLIGIGIGLVVATILALARVKFMRSATYAVVMIVISFGVVGYGKAEFVASLAENRFAGKLWYFGSMASSAAVFVGLFILLLALAQRFR